MVTISVGTNLKKFFNTPVCEHGKYILKHVLAYFVRFTLQMKLKYLLSCSYTKSLFLIYHLINNTSCNQVNLV